ncbi:MAG TPA: sensor domain-containing diguanylate cyclase [Acidimicrobiales bacterium]|nr:sensor domain-containing diguanylate cyclase [Acidimicrobiales bacterium]
MAVETSSQTEDETAGILSPTSMVRLAAVLFFACGLVTLLSPLAPTPPGFQRFGVAAVGIAAVVSAPVVWFLPWARWPRWTSQLLAIPALALIGLHNYFGGEDPYRYPVFYMVTWVWLGLAHRRWTSLRWVPALAISYVVPLYLHHAPAWAMVSLVYVVPVLVLVAEMMGWAAARIAKVQAAVSSAEQRLSALVSNVSDIIGVLDGGQRVTYVNPAITRVLGYEPDHLLGSLFGVVVHDADHYYVSDHFAEAVASPGEPVKVEFRARRNDGTVVLLGGALTSRVDDPAVGGVIVTLTDVTGQREYEAHLRHEALHDNLTGLANRTLLMDRLVQATRRAERTGGRPAVLFFDLDRFKGLNDSMGHAVGDRVLTAVAERIRPLLRSSDTLCRYGGDEFAVLCEDVTDEAEAMAIGERIVEAMARPFKVGDLSLQMSTSVGVAVSGTPVVDHEVLLGNADAAMYVAKERGRGRCELFDERVDVWATQQPAGNLSRP